VASILNAETVHGWRYPGGSGVHAALLHYNYTDVIPTGVQHGANTQAVRPVFMLQTVSVFDIAVWQFVRLVRHIVCTVYPLAKTRVLQLGTSATTKQKGIN
jgi:hypothetical protein